MPSSRSSSSHRVRDGGSRRARSSTRSRSRHRDRRSHSRSHSRFHLKHNERNFPAAVCNMITIVILCVAMAEPKWIFLTGGGCTIQHGNPGDLHHLGINEFFFNGILSYQGNDMLYPYGPGEGQVLVNCVDVEAVQQFKTIIALCLTTVVISLIAFLLDLVGPSRKLFQTLHRYAIFSIITVIMCVVINVLCYLISSRVWTIQKQTKLHLGSKVDVTFDISFYLISAAGSMAVFAVACNCFRRYPMYEEHPYQRMEEDDLESILPASYHDMSPMENLPPPPAYTPSPNMPSASATPPATAPASELPSYSESVGSAQASSTTPAPQPSSASSRLSVNV